METLADLICMSQEMVHWDKEGHNQHEDGKNKVLTAIVEVDDELEVAHELEVQVPRAVQVPAEVTSVIPCNIPNFENKENQFFSFYQKF